MKRGMETLIRRVLIVGHGSIGKRHLRIVRSSLPNAQIMLLLRKNNLKKPEIANVISTSLTDAIAFEPEIAIIANPAPFHFEITHKLIKIGCNVLIEKPISTDLNEAKTLVEELEYSDAICQVGYNLHFLPSLKKFRDLAVRGYVGKTMSVRCEVGQYLPDWRPEIDYRNSVSSQKCLGGGVLFELSHEINYLHWIFGEVEKVSGWLTKTSDLDIDVEDTAHLIIGFKSSETVGSLTATVNMDFVRRDKTRSCTLIGEKGSLFWNGIDGKISIRDNKSANWSTLYNLPHTPDESYQEQWKYFLNCVKHKKNNPAVSVNDGLQTLKIIQAARSSAKNQSQQIFLDHR